MNNKTILHHGTNAEFDSFQMTGGRLTSIGKAHYFSPDLNTAKMYGKNIKTIAIDTDLILDLGNPSEIQRADIISLLNEVVPDDIKAGYGKIQRIDITNMDDDLAYKLFKEKQAETAHFWHDRAKAQIEEDGDKCFIQWQNPGLENATASNLLNLLQEYRQNIPVELGYKAAQNGDEVAVYDTGLVNELLRNKHGELKMKDLVSNNGNGAIINANYRMFLAVKDEKDFRQWQNETQLIRFGTYQNMSILDVIENFNEKEVPISQTGINANDYINTLQRLPSIEVASIEQSVAAFANETKKTQTLKT